MRAYLARKRARMERRRAIDAMLRRNNPPVWAYATYLLALRNAADPSTVEWKEHVFLHNVALRGAAAVTGKARQGSPLRFSGLVASKRIAKPMKRASHAPIMISVDEDASDDDGAWCWGDAMAGGGLHLAHVSDKDAKAAATTKGAKSKQGGVVKSALRRLKYLRTNKHEAATHIQRIWRGFRVKRLYKGRLEAYYDKLLKARTA